MSIPASLLYSEDHEWARIEGDTAVVGITDYAQGELGDIVFVEMPEPGSTTSQQAACGSIEAVKAVSDILAPLSGEVIEINTALEDNPSLINEDPYGEGWIFKIQLSDPSEKETLLSADDYEAQIS